MSEGEKRHAGGGSGAEGPAAGSRNLLSSVAPPSVLPNFVMSAVPASQLPPSTAPQSRPVEPQPTSSASTQPLHPTPAPHAPGSPDKFSPAIPPKKGEPTVAIRSPEGSQTTTQSPVSLPSSTPDRDPIGDPMPGSGLLTWVRGAVTAGGPAWLHRVAEKAKSSVDSMITTLDPQMKEYLNSGGDIQIVVASDKDWDVSPIRDAFQTVFGKATITGMSVEASDEVTAAQAVGAGAAYAATKHRLAQLRAAHAQLHNNVPIIAVEGFLLETPGDRWFEASLLLLSQPSLGVELQSVSQWTSVPTPVIAALRAATPPDYPHAESGLAATAASVLAQNLQVLPPDWQEAISGVPRREMLHLAARALAGSYKKLLHLSSLAPPT